MASKAQAVSQAHSLSYIIAAGHTDSVEAVALSSVLPVAATASIDGKVLIWDNATLSVRGTCEHPEVCSSA